VPEAKNLRGFTHHCWNRCAVKAILGNKCSRAAETAYYRR
jgi:hypothetical protein